MVAARQVIISEFHRWNLSECDFDIDNGLALIIERHARHYPLSDQKTTGNDVWWYISVAAQARQTINSLIMLLFRGLSFVKVVKLVSQLITSFTSNHRH